MTQTYYQPVRWTLDLKESTERLARRRLRLMELSFEIVHRPGHYHEVADATSRLPLKAAEEEEGSGDVDEYVQTYCIVEK